MQDRTTAVGLSTLMFATLAVISGQGLSRRASPDAPSATAERETEPPEPTTTKAKSREDSLVTNGRELLGQFFGDTAWHRHVCQDVNEPALTCFDLDVLIVALPDPIDSFLDWAFDADLEAMRRAFESARFVADRFWLPWYEDKRIEKDRRPTLLRRSHPGVMLFRQSDPSSRRLRLVYVVGEVSTGGVHKAALEAALNERRELLATRRFVNAKGARITGVGDTIRFVGPFFTGSSLSTRMTLERWRSRSGDHRSFALFISGSASGTTNQSVFDTTSHSPIPARNMAFHATVNADPTISQAMQYVVIDALQIPAEQIAILRESSTQYGQQSSLSPAADRPFQFLGDSSAGQKLVVPMQYGQDVPLPGFDQPRRLGIDTITRRMLDIPYPMSISSLRAEYAKHPAPEGASDEITGGKRSRIPLVLDLSNQQLESPIPVSQLTPATLELMLDGIVHTIKEHEIRAIGIVGTDVRDKIFLADELHKRLPDARLFTFGANALYLRGEYNRSLRGMLIFSTYPLVLENQWWDTTRILRRRHAFASDDAEGVYNATLRQLGKQRWFLDYAPPFEAEKRRPPVWVTVVGRHAFVPVVAFRDLDALEYLEPGERVSARQHPSTDDRPSSFFMSLGISPDVLAAGLVPFSSLVVAVVAFLVVLRSDRTARHHAPVHEPEPPLTKTSREIPLPPPAGDDKTDEHVGRDFVKMQRRGQRAVLLFHREVFTLLRHLSLLSVFTGVWLVLPNSSDDPTTVAGALTRLSVLSALIALVLLWVFGVRARTVWQACGSAFREYAYPSLRTDPRILALQSPREQHLWRVESRAVILVAILGVANAAMVGWFLVNVLRLHPDLQVVFLERARQLDSGVSPVLLIIVSAVAFVVICSWQLSRITLLDETTAFEEAFLHRAERAATSTIDEIKSKIATGLRAARSCLSRTVPDFASRYTEWIAIGVAVVLVVAIWSHFGRSYEVLTNLSATLQPTRSNAPSQSPFDIILKLSVIMILAATVWSVARLVTVWMALRKTLRALGASPLVTAFERLPRRIARLTRLTLFSEPSRTLVLTITCTQWLHLRRLFHGNRMEFERVDLQMADNVRALMAQDAPLHGRDYRRAGATFASELRAMLDVMEHFWEAEPADGQIGAVIGGLGKVKPGDGASTSGQIRRSFPDPVRLWLRTAEEFVAVQAVDYIAWVLRHLRQLVILLLLLVVLTMALLSSYEFVPQSVVRSLFLILFVGTIVSLLTVLAQMNRDEVLSRITRTDPGRLTWDTTFVINVALVAAVPLLTLLSALSPAQTDLFGWIDRVIGVLGKH
jgi:hypothetical protein